MKVLLARPVTRGIFWVLAALEGSGNVWERTVREGHLVQGKGGGVNGVRYVGGVPHAEDYHGSSVASTWMSPFIWWLAFV